jgi:hypothetical protein
MRHCEINPIEAVRGQIVLEMGVRVKWQIPPLGRRPGIG